MYNFRVTKFLTSADISGVQIIDPRTIIIELNENITNEIIDTSNLKLKIESRYSIDQEHDKKITYCDLTRVIFNKLIFAKHSAHYAENDHIVFCLPEYRTKIFNLTNNPIFLATDFNNWYDATKDKKFQLQYTNINNEPFFSVSLPITELPTNFQYKFVTINGEWISPTIETKNKIFTSNNVCNYYFDSSKTGNHIIALTTDELLLSCDKFTLLIDNIEYAIDILPWLFSMYTDAPLGANIQKNSTTFRVFIPRAYSVRTLLYPDINAAPQIIPMYKKYDHTWEAVVNKNLHGYLYHYQALFYNQTDWEQAPKILDPYAKATCSSSGPGIILKQRTFLPLRDNFVLQHIKDDVILEAHLRDLLKHAPIQLTADQRLTFNGLSKWIRKKSCYLRKLGINTLELQPIQEPDAHDKFEYHWGYMPVNYFSPASIYSSSYKKSPKEFKKFVHCCHHANIAVIMDVVYNHIGTPNHLYHIDHDYFFRKNPDGTLQNFSGCGNDLRTESPMVQRLIIDSLTHFIKTYRVDGFRFDLAELLGQEFLHQLETQLKEIKNDVQIIYEPWSFRNNIGHQLKHSSASAWNDEYREFVANYVRGNGNANGIEYFLKGSLNFRTNLPYQSINYVSSHDDRCWIDKITENQNFNGQSPTEIDKKRTHLALAITMMSIGVPMLSAGQDILFSKRGYSNTYQAGDINAIDYNLLHINQLTHKFFKRWIRFRLSRKGQALRLTNRPTDNYFSVYHSNSSAIGILYNADNSIEAKRIFFAINPHNYTAKINLKTLVLDNFRKLSDSDKFFNLSKKFSENVVNNELILPALSLSLWVEYPPTIDTFYINHNFPEYTFDC